ncbi:MAG: hypothetical protein LBT55_01740 [Clostridiaceae bacterium]|nr:hypothetical protein [Clostridiaceae bacterium]
MSPKEVWDALKENGISPNVAENKPDGESKSEIQARRKRIGEALLARNKRLEREIFGDSPNQTPYVKLSNSAWGKAKIQEESVGVDKMMTYYTDKKSKWSGKTVIDDKRCKKNDSSGLKAWNCNIIVPKFVETCTLIHEHLHARSVSYYNKKLYHSCGKTEEGAVELFAQEISKDMGLTFTPGYTKLTGMLRYIQRVTDLCGDIFSFAQEFYEIDMPERYGWLVQKVEEFVNNDTQLTKNKRTRLLNVTYAFNGPVTGEYVNEKS